MTSDDRGPGPDSLLTPAEVADRLRVSVGSIYDELNRGNLRGSKVGQKWRIRARDVEVYLDANANLPSVRLPIDRPRRRAL